MEKSKWKTASIKVRVTERDLKAMLRQANKDQIGLSEWVRGAIKIALQKLEK